MSLAITLVADEGASPSPSPTWIDQRLINDLLTKLIPMPDIVGRETKQHYRQLCAVMCNGLLTQCCVLANSGPQMHADLQIHAD